MQNNKGSGKKDMMGVIVCIGVAIFGILFTTSALSSMEDSAFGFRNGEKMVIIAFGALFVLVAVANAVRFYKGEVSRKQAPGDHMAGSSDKEELVDRIVSEVRKTQQPQRRAEKWTCAYCGTAVNDEESCCPACGAGRKKSVHNA